jgi:hypothetical protein
MIAAAATTLPMRDSSCFGDATGLLDTCGDLHSVGVWWSGGLGRWVGLRTREWACGCRNRRGKNIISEGTSRYPI